MQKIDKILKDKVDSYRALSFDDLEKWAESDKVISVEVTEGSKEYQIEIDALWDDKRNKHIRVSGSAYEVSSKAKWWQPWRLIHKPVVSEDFIIASDGSFVDE